MKFLTVWWIVTNPLSANQIDSYTAGFSSLADCAKVEQSITRQYKKYKYNRVKHIFKDGGGNPIYHRGCL